MGMTTQQASKLGIAQYGPLNVNSIPNQYTLYMDTLPGPQNGKFWRVHAMLAQMFQTTNNQSEMAGIFICAPGTPPPGCTDVDTAVIPAPGYVRVDGWTPTNGTQGTQGWQHACELNIGGIAAESYLEMPSPKRDIIVPPTYFLRAMAIFGGTAPTASQIFGVFNILYEQEDTC
jgi:hypothetical protein